MSRTSPTVRRSTLAVAAAFASLTGGVVAAPHLAASAPNDVGVIVDEVYGGGGNSGATYTHDFVELYNTTDAAIDLTGWSVQYKSSTGTWANGSQTNLTGTIPAHGSFLVQEAQGAGGTTPLPTPDAIGTIALSGSTGVVALVADATRIGCTGTTCVDAPSVVDLVGWGSGANTFFSAPAPGTGNTTSVSRSAAHGNTWSNAADFTAGTPTPTSTASGDGDDGGDGGDGDGGDGGTVTPIAAIQGTGDASPLAGQTVTTRGVVTAAYPVGGVNGYVIQTPGTGGDTDLAARTASDGLFVFSSSTVGLVAVGDYVEVTGAVSEYFGLTELTVPAPSGLTVLGAPPAPVAPLAVAWPATDADREKVESMLFTPTGTYTVSDTYATNQYGEVGLAFGDTPLRTPTDVANPTDTATYAAAVADNAARAVTLDDGRTTNFLSSANSGLTPPYISLTSPLRVGEHPTFAAPVIVDFRNDIWKLSPTTPIDAATAPSFVTFGGDRVVRPDAAALGTGTVKVASFNVLNYFTTLGADAPGCTSYNDRAGDPITVNSCTGNGPRGAWNAENLARQQAKIVAAINALDADVVGLMEIENSAALGEPADEALATLVVALNAAAGAPVWAYVPSSTQLPPVAEQDVITNAIIYRPATVTRLGASVALGTESADGEAFSNAREPIGQVFAQAGAGDPFLVVVNHFKSKGSATFPEDADTGDGQGAANWSRVRQAEALAAWVPTVAGPAGADDVFLLGDFNSYTEEDPLQVLYAAGYTDVNSAFDTGKQSYSFDGQNGSLDHILANPGALARVTGADIWNVNAPESIALEYSRYNYHGTLFYDASPFRASDHDPVIAAITPAAPAPAGTTAITLVSINDFHGRIDANTVKWAGTVEQIVGSAGGADVAITGAGDLVSASLFASAVQNDQPTIDVMNAIGLDVSAVGNHEFDKGWADLRDRIIAGGDNAQWIYLGANVYAKGTETPVLPEYAIVTIDGVRVGVVGAVTEETPTLVSPGGIAEIDFGDPVDAVNRVAAQLSDGEESNGEADVVVATFHEGAPDGAPDGATLEDEVAKSAVFRRIVEEVSPDVDVLFNGHTHKVYAWDAPVPGEPGATRPVLQTGNYGENVGKVVLTVDDATKDIVGYTAVNVPRTAVDDAALIAAYPALAEVDSITDEALADAAVVGNQPIGTITDDITTAYANGTYGPDGYEAPRTSANRDQRQLESTLGNLVATSLRDSLADPDRGGAQIGVVNPGGLRAELFYPTDPVLGEGDGVVTYAEANSVLPFVNNLWTTTLTGAQFKTLLEQQWQRDAAGNVPSRSYLQLGLSDNVTYTFDASLPEGSRITSITIDGVPYDPAASYRIGMFSFLGTGGDNFRVFTQGTDTRDSGLVDRDAWIDYVQAQSPVAPDYARRAVAVSPLPTTATTGQPLAFGVSQLDLTSLGSPANTTLEVSLGGVSLGSFPVTAGAASVDVVVPESVPLGDQPLLAVASPSGTTVSLQVHVVAGADTTPPAPPVITGPVDGAVTNQLWPILTGTAEPGSRVVVRDGSRVVGSVLAGSGGTWTLAPSFLLLPGVHTFTATATDAAGNVSAASAAVRVTIDVLPPAPPVMTSPWALSVQSKAAVPVSGRAESSTTVRVYDGVAQAGSTTAGADGLWSLTTRRLDNGLHVLSATATDRAGNTSWVSLPVVALVCDRSGYPGGRVPLLLLLLGCR